MKKYTILVLSMTCLFSSIACQEPTQIPVDPTTAEASTMVPILTTTASDPPPSVLCKHLKNYKIASLTAPPYWYFKIENGCDFQNSNISLPSCFIYLAFCKEIVEGDLLNCDGSSACLRSPKNKPTSQIIGNFTIDPFNPLPEDSFEAIFKPGVVIFNAFTQKPCLVSIKTTFYCDLLSFWNNTDPTLPGQGPPPEDFQLVTISDRECQIQMNVPFAGACSAEKPGGGLSGGSILLILFISLVTVYLTAGVTYNVFVEKKSGLEIIPHYKTWSFIMISAVGGAIYAWRVVTCQSKGPRLTKSKYDDIGE